MAAPARWNDDYAYSLSERAYLLHAEGRYEESLILFEGLIDLYPENLYYMDAAAALHLALGRPEAALEMASAVLRREASHVQARMRRCEAYIVLRRLEEAEGDAQYLKKLGASNHAQRMAMRLAAARQKAERNEDFRE